MELTKLNSFKIGETTFHVKFTNRSIIDYESIIGESIALIDEDPKRLTEKQLTFFYCTAKAGAKAAGKDFNYSFDQFLDLVDDYYSETMIQFTNALWSKKADPTKKK